MPSCNKKCVAEIKTGISFKDCAARDMRLDDSSIHSCSKKSAHSAFPAAQIFSMRIQGIANRNWNSGIPIPIIIA
jgi:hypothetical protein